MNHESIIILAITKNLKILIKLMEIWLGKIKTGIFIN